MKNINKKKLRKGIVGNTGLVVKNKICSGCGACAVICPTLCITFIHGVRFNYPKINEEKCNRCGMCLKVCPSAFLLKGIDPEYQDDGLKKLYEYYTIYSTDDNIRIDSASGGFVTGLILHLMEKEMVNGAIVARGDLKNPLINESFVATSREDLLISRGSRYSPVSNCTALTDVLKYDGRYVFVGTPCQVEGCVKLQNLIPELKKKIALTIAFICFGTASRSSTRSYLKRYNVNSSKVKRICYRGDGWPGNFRVFGEDGLILKRPLLRYENNTVIGDELSHLVPIDHYLRCTNCLDHWGLFADISCADAWSHENLLNERKGISSIVIRTKRGRHAVASAVKNSDMVSSRIGMDDILEQQKALVPYMNRIKNSWMPLYQFIFFGRLMKPISILKNKGSGFKTILRARFNTNYYEEPKFLD